MAQKMIIDTDTASDDAVALVLALRDSRVEVLGITVVVGNVEVDKGVQNALYTAEMCGVEVPVYRGADRPLMHEFEVAYNVHGEDGMGDIGLPLSARKPEAMHGVDAIIALARAHPGEATLVTLGPLTNLALALRKDPEIAGLFKKVVVMGGTGDHLGNTSPVSEFNIWVDPEAAAMVFAAGLPLVMVGWDVSRKYATFFEDDVAALRAVSPLGQFCMDIQRQLTIFCEEVTKLDSLFDQPDPITMAIAIEPDIGTEVVHRHVAVETTGELARGMTIVDHLEATGQAPNAHVVLAANRDRFLEMLTEACR